MTRRPIRWTKRCKTCPCLPYERQLDESFLVGMTTRGRGKRPHLMRRVFLRLAAPPVSYT